MDAAFQIGFCCSPFHNGGKSPHGMSELGRFIKAVAPLRLKHQADILLKRPCLAARLYQDWECVFLK